ncbi:MAG: dihydropteroate synthase [Acidobacteria bacterium]|nr:dihydropteroate synthase [Acidobacteriota bacterium]
MLVGPSDGLPGRPPRDAREGGWSSARVCQTCLTDGRGCNEGPDGRARISPRRRAARRPFVGSRRPPRARSRAPGRDRARRSQASSRSARRPWRGRGSVASRSTARTRTRCRARSGRTPRRSRPSRASGVATHETFFGSSRPARWGRLADVIRARVLAASHVGELVSSLAGLRPEEASRLALAHPSRAIVLEGLDDPGPVEAALTAAGIPHARAAGTLAWAADPIRTAELHRLLADADPAALGALHRAMAGWVSAPRDVPLPGEGALRLSARAHVMGIVNVTPDSFSDGGRFGSPAAAVEHGLALAEEGADILDVGGESTRPGADRVDAAEEIRRVIPVVEGLAAKTPVPVSIDTTKAAVARAALDAGARILNDVSAGRFDSEILPLAAERGAPVVLMHMKGEPRTMQRDPVYADVVGEVAAFLDERAAAARAAGVAEDRILLDPGFGFGKTREHNLVLLARLRELRCLGYPVVAGTSRKSFIGATLGDLPVAERLEGTAATVALAVAAGAAVVRVHDVLAMARVASMVEAVVGAGLRGS